MSLLLALSSVLLAAATPTMPQCNPIPGWEQVLADQMVRWIVMGEMHGSNEMPEAFGDAVCLTAGSGPVVVGLEIPSSDQAKLDSYVASDGGAEARRAFLGAQFWNGEFKDGRSSEAGFRLIERLRQMRAAGRIDSVIAFQPSSGPTEPEGYEKAMAEILRVAARPGAKVIALVGNVHARRTEVNFGTRYLPMAAHLPRDETVTLNTISDGGDLWVCTGNPVKCGKRSSPSRGPRHERGLVMNKDRSGPYSGVINLGSATTASPPQSGTGGVN